MNRSTPPRHITLARDEVAAAVLLAVTCAVVYLVMIKAIRPILSETDESGEIGAMWAVISTIFVFRVSRVERLHDAGTRMSATAMSLVICFLYLLIFPVTAVGIGIVIGVSSLLAAAMGRPQDASLTSITSTVVLIVADLGQPGTRWLQPVLRLVDTGVGILAGLAAAALLGLILKMLSVVSDVFDIGDTRR